jgi:SAM-dependent methyltransferase
MNQFYRVVRRLIRTKCEFETLRTLYHDFRFGGYCGGFKASPYEKLGANATMSVEYWMLDELFERANVTIRPDDVLVDVGCGKGRVINYWLSKGYRNRIFGLEIDPAIADQARTRLRRFPNVTVVTGDAIQNIPADATVFWLYNPFSEGMMLAFKARLQELFCQRPGVRIVYFNCHQRGVFGSDPRWRVQSLGLLNNMPAVLVELISESVAAKQDQSPADVLAVA